MAVGIGQHDFVRRQIVDRARHQVANRICLLLAQRTMLQLQHHRSLGRALLVGEKRIVGHGQRHSRRLRPRPSSRSCARARLRAPADNSPSRRTPSRSSSACRRTQSPSARSSGRPWRWSAAAPCPGSRTGTRIVAPSLEHQRQAAAVRLAAISRASGPRDPHTEPGVRPCRDTRSVRRAATTTSTSARPPHRRASASVWRCQLVDLRPGARSRALEAANRDRQSARARPSCSCTGWFSSISSLPRSRAPQRFKLIEVNQPQAFPVRERIAKGARTARYASIELEAIDLELHAHHRLIGRNRLAAHRQRHLKGQVGLLRSRSSPR